MSSSADDKRQAVEQAIKENPEPSERELAKRCGVSWDMVCAAKKRLGMKAVVKTLPLSLLTFDDGLQMRTVMDDDYADELAKLLKEEPELELPAVVVFESPEGTCFVPDGFHRGKAYRLAGRERIPVKVHKGGRAEALAYALGANEDHGLRRSPADRRRAVQIALADPAIGQQSIRDVAKLCKVSYYLVEQVKAELSGERTVRNGSRPPAKAVEATPPPGGSESARSSASEPFRRPGNVPCADCDQSFDRLLWHCPGCGRHWLPSQAECGACQTARPMTEEEYERGEEAILEQQADDLLADTFAAESARSGAKSEPKNPAGPPEPVREAVQDALGRQVPDGLVEVFKRLTPFRSIIQRLGAIKSELAELKSFGVGTDHLRTHEIHADLDNAQKAIRFAAPYAVCPKCQGTRCKGKDSLCQGLGWIREDQYGRLSDQQKSA